MTEELAEIVAEEDGGATARNLPAVVAHEAMVTRGEITAAEVREQRDKIKDVMRTVMERDQHYGVIPGVNKPTLLKAGAEVLAVTFRLAPHYTSERIFHDDGHLTVVSKVTLVHIPSGLTIAEGEGLCTSREKKYGKRKADRICPACGVPAIIKGKQEYGGGWLCWKKRDGCGSKFAEGDEAIESQDAGEVDNPDLADTFNTVLKMANKRALIAAILNGTAASDIFTQDVEDAAPPAPPVEEKRQEQAGREAKVPRSGADVKARLTELLGEDEAGVWLAQAADYAKGQTLAPTGLQRLAGVVVNLEEDGQDFRDFPGPEAREKVQAVFAARFDGAVFPGPEWAMNAKEAEAGMPAKALPLDQVPF